MLSSTYHGKYGASRCIDGNTNNFCHSKKERAWLRLDLGQQQLIASVKIWNRQDCCKERFGAHVVETSNDGTSFTTCGAYTLPNGPGPYTESCIATARYVRVRMTHVNNLNLAEVQVLARTSRPTTDKQSSFSRRHRAARQHARTHARHYSHTRRDILLSGYNIQASVTKYPLII